MRESTKVAKSSAKLLSAEFINIIFGIFYFLIITRTFSKIEMAAIAIMGVITNISAVVIGFGLHATSVKLIPEYLSKEENENLSEILQITYILVIFASIFFVFFTFLFSSQISSIFFKSPSYSNLIKIISFSIFTNKLFETSYHNLTAFQKFTEISLLQIMNNVFVRIYALFLYFSSGIEGYLIGLITGQFIISICMIFLTKQYLFKKIKEHNFKKILKFSFPFYLNGYIGYGANHADSLIVSIFLSPSLIATYYVVRRFIDYLEIFITSILTPLSPKMVEMKKNGKETLEKIFYKSTRYLSFILIPTCLFMISISYFLLDIYGKGKYLSGLPILIILSLGMIFNGFYLLLRGTIFVCSKPIETTKVELFKACINILLPLTLIRKFNILGISCGKFISLFTSVFFAYYIGKKLLILKFDWENIKKSFLISFFSVLLIIILQILFYTPFWMILYICVGIIVFSLLFFKFTTQDEKLFFKEILLKWNN
ncbi:MAG TPA: oligosaccharide flippase family protein [Candidatus Ratteibacteria bacterium]|nr:oligosaccharide flippase family protein [Candidatus Ratteibacteria bacterium]